MRHFLKDKGVLSGVFMLLFYQIIMIGTFMWGYSAVPKNINELSVAIVNEDQQQGALIAGQIGEGLPFRLATETSLTEAQQKLEDRDIHLIIHIPQDFTQKLTQQGAEAQIDYYLNQSNPATVNSTLQSVADQITAKISSQIQTQGIQGILQNMQVPEDQSKTLAAGVMNKLSSNLVITNPQPAGMHNQMAPMFLTMANYVGAMIYSMMAATALNRIKRSTGKWKAFLSLQGVNVLLALIAPLIGLSVYFGIHGYGADTFVKMWLLHSLELFGAIQFTSMFCLLLGQAGMLLNMPLLLIQTISSGAVLPRAMMPGFFQAISHISVMYYTVQLDYNTLFGGGQTSALLLSLGAVTITALAVNTVIHSLKSAKEISGSPVPQPLLM